MAMDFFDGDESAATKWLESPLHALGGKSPRDIAESSDAGAKRILDLIGRAEYGVFA